MPLYEVAILEQPTQEEEDKGAVEKLVLPPTNFISPDSQSAAIDAMEFCRESNIPVNKERKQILVRPFV